MSSNQEKQKASGPLSRLGVDLVDQSVLEKSIIAQADKDMAEREEELDRRRLSKVRAQKIAAQDQLEKLKQKLKETANRETLLSSITEQTKKLRDATSDEHEILNRIKERASGDNKQESTRDYLIRTGKIMPFDTTPQSPSANISMTHTSMLAPSFKRDSKGRLLSDKPSDTDTDMTEDEDDHGSDGDEYLPETSESMADNSDEEDTDVVEIDEDEYEKSGTTRRLPKLDESYTDDGIKSNYDKRLREWVQNRRILRHQLEHPDMAIEDIVEELGKPTKKDFDEIYKPHPNYEDAEINQHLRITGDLWDCLFDYQKTCLRWLAELHSMKTGGIIGDEMGLGKTLQIVAFLSSLYYSKVIGPGQANIIVCPNTVMKQWVQEFHKWAPSIRVAILHSTGCAIKSAKKKKGSDSDSDSDYQDEQEQQQQQADDIGYLDDDQVDDIWNHSRKGKKKAPKKKRPSFLGTKAGKNAAALVNEFVKVGGVLVTSYSGVQTYRDVLLKQNWGYAVLDEGHRIRNPNAMTTILVKRLKTIHRFILSGTPIQNNLKELWSLFDFVYPGRLGDLPLFEKHFSIPINLGSYANASNFQVQIAYKCALMLRDSINPYLLRRMKADVATDLPTKNEQVLFCKLTDIQRQRYIKYTDSSEMDSIKNGRLRLICGIDTVRKICNHPDIFDPTMTIQNNPDYGNPERSGKQLVVQALLKMWKESGEHRVLLFCQTRQMLDILEVMVRKEKYGYLRMDGATPVDKRIGLVNEFNRNPSFYVFLLTTKVGGVGLNLTGADRVIIYDPDWNPSTDMQARERAWRIGQTKDVTIYRLMTSGTIEEKIYHRQIYKQYLSNKILVDPMQRRFSSAENIQSLFALGADDALETETGKLFKDSQVIPPKKNKKIPKKKRVRTGHGDDSGQLKSLQGVDSMEKFTGEKQRNKGGEDNVLNSLFEMTGIQSALEHDKIMNASYDKVLVEQEAERVAKQAEDALKESRRQSKRFGIARSLPSARSASNETATSSKKTPLHSSQIFAKLRERNMS